MRLGIVIVNYNGREYIAECLRSLESSRYRPAQVVCIDNQSPDGSAELIAREFPWVTLIRNPANTGFTGGVNRGMRHCVELGLDAVLLLNPDTIVEPFTLDALVRGMERHPRAILAPAIYLHDRPQVPRFYAGDISWWRGRVVSGPLNGTATPAAADTRVSTASGCCLMIPARAVQDVGLLDDSYFLYFEDADYLERAAAAGYEIWHVPDAVVLHGESRATGGRRSPLAMYYFVRNRHYFVRKFRGGTPVYAAFLAYSAADVAGRMLRSLASGRPSLAAAVARGALHAWRGSVGKCEAVQRAAGRP